MKIINCEQRSPEWYAARLGIPTASNFDKIVITDGSVSKQAKKYMYKLIGERLAGASEDSYENEAMIQGREMEDEARQLYQIATGQSVEQVGFCLADTCVGVFGCSPDGLVGETGLIEIKCPTMAVHVEYLIDDKLPTKYIQQVQGQLLVTGREWCDFVSYYPGIKPLIVRVKPDKKFITELKKQLYVFCNEIELITKQLEEK